MIVKNERKFVNVSELIYFYKNERTLNRLTELEKQLQFAGVKVNENVCFKR